MSSADRRVREREQVSRWLRRATAAFRARARRLAAIEPLEDALCLLVGKAGPLVGDLE